jgi:mannosyl-3-phosphoglycerate phosphatase
MQELEKNKSVVAVFTDLDGTLLDDNYSFLGSKPVIDQLLALNVRIIFSSNKTRFEIEHYREKLDVKDPFIVENGAAIFVPKDYFKTAHNYTQRTEQYDIFELGVSYSKIRETLSRISEISACTVKGFGDMSAEEVANDSGLPLELAKLAKQREYTEPFKISSGESEVLLSLIKNEGLNYAKGQRYYQLTGNHDKGKAVSLLKEWFLEEFGALKTFGVGNESNDLPMLNLMDKSFFIEKIDMLQVIWVKLLKEVLQAI